jgi:2-polyprenyl-3-methyl-5-hydroxy-6-metoxy-1,4-benzoquinol methylase
MADVVVCSNCGFHYSTYKDDEYAAVSAHSEQKTLDEKTVRYIQQKLESNPFRFDKHEATVLKFSTPAKHSLLDIGFGGAVFLQKMKIAGFDCYGIELDKQYMLYAKEVLQLSNVYSLPVQDNFWQQNHQSFFDVIVLWDVLEHVNDPVQFIQSIAALLKPGGQRVAP